MVNPLNAELIPICHLLALLEAHPILHVSRIRESIRAWAIAFITPTHQAVCVEITTNHTPTNQTIFRYWPCQAYFWH